MGSGHVMERVRFQPGWYWHQRGLASGAVLPRGWPCVTKYSKRVAAGVVFLTSLGSARSRPRFAHLMLARAVPFAEAVCAIRGKGLPSTPQQSCLIDSGSHCLPGGVDHLPCRNCHRGRRHCCIRDCDACSSNSRVRSSVRLFHATPPCTSSRPCVCVWNGGGAMGCASVSGAQCLSSMCFFGGPPVFCCLRLRLPCTAPTHSSRGHGSISYRIVRLFRQSGVLVTCCPALVVALGIVVPFVVAVYALCVVMATFVPGIMVGVVESSTT